MDWRAPDMGNEPETRPEFLVVDGDSSPGRARASFCRRLRPELRKHRKGGKGVTPETTAALRRVDVVRPLWSAVQESGPALCVSVRTL